MSDHITEFTLERECAEELDAKDSWQVRTHIEQCERCRAQHQRLLDRQRDFLALAPTLDAHARLVRKLGRTPPPAVQRMQRTARHKTRVWLLASIVLLALGMLLWIVVAFVR